MWRKSLALVSIGVVGGIGCGDSGRTVPNDIENTHASVTLIVPDQESDYFRAIQAGAIEGALVQGVELAIPEQASSTPDQIAAITDAIARGDDGIAIAPVSREVDSALSAARNAGLKVVTIGGTGIEIENSDFTVQTDDCVLGLAAGQWIAGRMPEGSLLWPDFNAHFVRVLGDTGEYPRPTCRDKSWLEGAGIDPMTVAQVPANQVPNGVYAGGVASFDIPCTVVFEGDLERVTQKVQECVTRHPEVNAAYASNGELALAAAEGLRFAGKTVGVDVLLTTIGGTGDALDLAHGSWVNATARPRVRATGGGAIGALTLLIRGQAPEVQGGKDFMDTGVDLCTNDPKTAVFVAITLSIADCWSRLTELDP